MRRCFCFDGRRGWFVWSPLFCGGVLDGRLKFEVEVEVEVGFEDGIWFWDVFGRMEKRVLQGLYRDG